MTKNKKRICYECIGLGSLLFIIILLISLLVANVSKLQGTARVVNYAAMVRGVSQRIVKFEIVGKELDILMVYTDNLLDGLQNSSEAFKLKRIEDDNFQENVLVLDNMWKILKEEIYLARKVGYEKTEIIQASEDFFNQANKTVTTAETFSQRIVDKLLRLEIFLAIAIIIYIVLLQIQIVNFINLLKRNSILEEKAYIDLHTKLPNKSKCIEVLSDASFIRTSTAVLVFDINYLKQVNDKLGHTAGDTLIQNFANIIRTSIPPKNFVGRNGGDEFVAIIYNTSEEEIKSIIENIKIDVEKYNEFSNQIVMCYSVGYDISTNYKETSLAVLLQKADENMYTEKEAFHKKSKHIEMNYESKNI